MPEITACIVARDEAQLLGACLDSVRDAVAEIILVDHGSRDGTPELARERGARVLRSEAHFHELARNEYLEAARTPWVLVIDADERLAAGGAEAMAKLVREAPEDVQGFALERFDWIGHGRWASTRLVRLFRLDPQVRYFPSRAHAAVAPAIGGLGGRIALGHAPLHHLDALTPRDHRAKRAGMRARLEHELAAGTEMSILRCFYALELFAIGDEELSTEQLERAQRDDPRCEPIARLFLAQQHLLRHRLEGALTEADRVLALGENRRFRGRASAHVARADALDQLGQRPAAVAAMQLAIHEEPDLASHHLNLAALLEPTDLDAARAQLTAALRLNPWIGAKHTLTPGATPSIFLQQDALLSSVARVDQLVTRLEVG